MQQRLQGPKKKSPAAPEGTAGDCFQTTRWRPSSRNGPLTFLERETYLSLERARAALAIEAPTQNFAELAAAGLATGCHIRNERRGMIQHVGRINAEAEALGFGDPECLLDVRVEGPVSETRQDVGRQDSVFAR